MSKIKWNADDSRRHTTDWPTILIFYRENRLTACRRGINNYQCFNQISSIVCIVIVCGVLQHSTDKRGLDTCVHSVVSLRSSKSSIFLIFYVYYTFSKLILSVFSMWIGYEHACFKWRPNLATLVHGQRMPLTYIQLSILIILILLKFWVVFLYSFPVFSVDWHDSSWLHCLNNNCHENEEK